MSPQITTIRKRNGQVVPFEQDKITNAVRSAFFAVTNNVHEEEALIITEEVLGQMREKIDNSDETFVLGVEDIQDLVELSIMQKGFHDVAKSYIIYRFEHTKIREDRKEEVKERIEKEQLFVVKRSGETEVFSIEKIRETILRAAKGIEDDINVPDLINQIQREVYDGITTRDVAGAAVLVARSFIERDPSYSELASRLLLQNVIYKDAIDKSLAKTFEESYRLSFKKSVERGVKKKLIDKRILDFNLIKIAEAIKPERDELLKYLGTQTLLDRYFIREKEVGEHEFLLETPQFMWMRVAMGLCFNEDRKEETAINFYNILSSLRFVSSTPTLFHSGTPYPQLSSCYLGVTDDSLESIFKAYSDCASLSKHAGGIGWAWSKLRSGGALVKTTNIESNGVIPFLKIADSVTVAINRSGRRRGATCVYLEPWHLDFEDFIELRKNTGDDRRRTHDMNTASWIPDLFMKRVREGGDWTLFTPDETPDLPEKYGKAFEEAYEKYEEMTRTGEIKLFKTIKARDLWRKMITQLFETGHPWITFKDPSNIRSPQDHAGVIHSSNLCTEITLNTSADDETAVCNLGSVNLAKHVVRGKLSENLIRETVMTGMHMLDNVIDINYYPTEEARKSNMRHRPVGLGLMGFQDALYLQGIDFESTECVEFADRSMEMISFYSILASSILAKNRGVYESYKGSKWDRGILPIDTMDLLEKERGEKIPIERKESMDWSIVRDSIRKYGMRNSNCLAMAPTATISNIAGCFPTIEPIFKNIYVKANISGEFIIMNHYLVEDLKKEGLWSEEMLEVIKGHEGNISRISAIPEWMKRKYKEVFDIDSKWMVKVAAQRGVWIDQSQSFNIFYKGASGKELSDIYSYAWELGLKTTYYLRTLGAGLEKSTVKLANQVVESSVIAEAKATAAEAIAEIKEKVVVEARVTEPKEKEIPAMPLGLGSADPKLCKIDDPDCEACQ